MIFISYRRSDGKAAAQLLQNLLIEHGFEKKDIFLDLHDILGEDFTERCRREIDSCDVFLLLVTKDSFIKHEGYDYYYDEIHHAININKKIVPIVYETEFNESRVPEEFKNGKLHLTNAIRFDVEYQNDSMSKIIKAVTKDAKQSFFTKIAQWFKAPLVIITIYLGVSLIGGVIRYFWDNYWLSDKTCNQIAAQNARQDNNGLFYYTTHDSLYVFYPRERTISVVDNVFAKTDADLSIIISKPDVFEVGFWNVAVALAYEITKHKIKPHGNSKQVGVIIAISIGVVAGFGVGFVCERMIFPVRESRIIRKKLHSLDMWDYIVRQKISTPIIHHDF